MKSLLRLTEAGEDGVMEFQLNEPLSPTETEQLLVLLTIFDKFRERNAKYQDLWKEGGWTDSAHHIRSKAARITRLLSSGTLGDAALMIDDAEDLANFCVFFIRNIAQAMGPKCDDPECDHSDCPGAVQAYIERLATPNDPRWDDGIDGGPDHSSADQARCKCIGKPRQPAQQGGCPVHPDR